MKRAKRLENEIITNQCVKWYRKYGHECEYSVWKLISLVKGYHGLTKIDKSELEISRRYADKVSSDLKAMDGMENKK